MKPLKLTLKISIPILIAFLIISCEKENEEVQIQIEADVPATVIIGNPDTLKFHIISPSPLYELSLWEGNKQRVLLDKTFLGSETLVKNLKFIYNPADVGVKAFEFRAVNEDEQIGVSIFNIEVVN